MRLITNDREGNAETYRDMQRQTDTDRDMQGHAETDTDRHSMCVGVWVCGCVGVWGCGVKKREQEPSALVTSLIQVSLREG